MDCDTVTQAKAFLKKLNLIFKECKTVKALKNLIKNDPESKRRLDDFELDDKYLLDIYKNGSLFTKIINTIVLPYLLRSEGCTPSNEYYRIDVIGYKKRGIDDDFANSGRQLGLIPYCWGFDYAIEHENAHGKWIDEAIKLAYINCSIRVVIGYNRKLKRGESLQEYENKCMDYLLDCIKQSNVQEGINNYLIIIFGERSVEQEWTDIRYNGYLVDYKKNRYDPL